MTETTHHATLSPSAASRWLECPGSVKLAATMPKPPESPHAAEGTAAHALCELEAKKQIFGMVEVEFQRQWRAWRKRYGIEGDQLQEMRAHAQTYVHYLATRRSELGAKLLLERKLDTGIEGCWGTADAILVTPDFIEVVDFKYGTGVKVDPSSPQLKLYALGAVRNWALLGDPETIRCTIIQPRVGEYGPKSEDYTLAELEAWGTQAGAIAKVALGNRAPFNPTATACRWCPASGRCKAQELAIMDAFPAPEEVIYDQPDDQMTPSAKATWIKRAPFIRQWLDALESAALEDIYDRGKAIPGYKVVRSNGRRSITVPGRAIALLEQAFPGQDVAERKPKSLGSLERIAKAHHKDLYEILGATVEKSRGKLSLVPESDKRDSLTREAETPTAEEVFRDVIS